MADEKYDLQDEGFRSGRHIPDGTEKKVEEYITARNTPGHPMMKHASHTPEALDIPIYKTVKPSQIASIRWDRVIYRMVSIDEGNVYGGQSVRVGMRMIENQYEAQRNPNTGCILLNQALNRHKFTDKHWIIEILYQWSQVRVLTLNLFEVEVIKLHTYHAIWYNTDSTVKPGEVVYNMSKGGDSKGGNPFLTWNVLDIIEKDTGRRTKSGVKYVTEPKIKRTGLSYQCNVDGHPLFNSPLCEAVRLVMEFGADKGIAGAVRLKKTAMEEVYTRNVAIAKGERYTRWLKAVAQAWDSSLANPSRPRRQELLGYVPAVLPKSVGLVGCAAR